MLSEVEPLLIFRITRSFIGKQTSVQGKTLRNPIWLFELFSGLSPLINYYNT